MARRSSLAYRQSIVADGRLTLERFTDLLRSEVGIDLVLLFFFELGQMPLMQLCAIETSCMHAIWTDV